MKYDAKARKKVIKKVRDIVKNMVLCANCGRKRCVEQPNSVLFTDNLSVKMVMCTNCGSYYIQDKKKQWNKLTIDRKTDDHIFFKPIDTMIIKIDIDF